MAFALIVFVLENEVEKRYVIYCLCIGFATYIYMCFFSGYLLDAKERLQRLTLQYMEASDVKTLMDEIVDSLGLFHVVPQFVYCYRSKGSKSERTVARIHGLGRIWQEALRRPPTYLIEVISERYDKLNDEEKEKTLIHELLHIPKGFSGGFRPHKGYVNRKRVERLHRKLVERRSLNERAENVDVHDR